MEDKRAHVHIDNGGDFVVDIDSDGIHKKPAGDDNKKERIEKGKKISNYLTSLGLLVALVVYIVLGCLIPSTWSYLWTIFLFVISLATIPTAIAKRKFSSFRIELAIVGTYCLVGLVTGIWHPTWVMFIGIPIYYTALAPFNDKNKK